MSNSRDFRHWLQAAKDPHRKALGLLESEDRTNLLFALPLIRKALRAYLLAAVLKADPKTDESVIDGNNLMELAESLEAQGRGFSASTEIPTPDKTFTVMEAFQLLGQLEPETDGKTAKVLLDALVLHLVSFTKDEGIQILRAQGHKVKPYGLNEKYWWEIDDRALATPEEIGEIADGVYSHDELIDLFIQRRKEELGEL
jgi:hypothetical protein